MKRRIIIITNAGKVGTDNYCEGVYKDSLNYSSFFTKAYGGYYSTDEIRILNKPSIIKVRLELSLLNIDNIEFSIIIFCGHGWYSTISESNIFCINDTEEMDSLEFRKNAKKRIIIEDNCRKPHAEYLFESQLKTFSALSDSKKQLLNPEECKLYYNKQISDCPEQLICAMACDINEVAGDSSSKGGYYSSSLIKETVNKVESDLNSINLSKDYIVYKFPTCHVNAIPRVQQLSGNKQNPQIEKPKFPNSNDYLPFAVIA